MDPAIKLFCSKVIPCLLYGVEIWGWGDQILSNLERTQNLFMRRILTLPMGSPVALMRAELGLPSLCARANVTILKFWMRQTRRDTDSLSGQSLLLLLERDKARSDHLNKLQSRYSIPDDLISTSGSRNDLRDWIYHMDAVIDSGAIAQSKVAPFFKLFKRDHFRSAYLISLPTLTLRMAFTYLRFQAMPTAVRRGRFLHSSASDRICICGSMATEDLIHYVLDCPLYDDLRNKHIRKLLPWSTTKMDNLIFLLSKILMSPLE